MRFRLLILLDGWGYSGIGDIAATLQTETRWDEIRKNRFEESLRKTFAIPEASTEPTQELMEELKEDKGNLSQERES